MGSSRSFKTRFEVFQQIRRGLSWQAVASSAVTCCALSEPCSRPQTTCYVSKWGNPKRAWLCDIILLNYSKQETLKENTPFCTQTHSYFQPVRLTTPGSQSRESALSVPVRPFVSLGIHSHLCFPEHGSKCQGMPASSMSEMWQFRKGEMPRNSTCSYPLAFFEKPLKVLLII